MKMDSSNHDAIDDALSKIEFPGEDERWIHSFLDERHFVDKVMRAVEHARVRLSRVKVWGAVGLLNVAILVVAGANPYLVQDVLALKDDLSTFFFGFLGLTLAGCILGVILSIDLSRLESFFQRLTKDVPGDWVKNLFRHPRE